MLSHTGGRDRYMPRFGKQSRLPEFLVVSGGKGRFLPLLSGSTSTLSWHTTWLRRAFGVFDPNIPPLTVSIYRAVLEELRSRNLVFEVDVSGAPVWGVALEALEVTTDVRQLRCDRCSLMLSVGPEAAQWMAGGPCPQRRLQDRHTARATAHRGLLRPVVQSWRRGSHFRRGAYRAADARGAGNGGNRL